jgi:hypothetical protein
MRRVALTMTDKLTRNQSPPEWEQFREGLNMRKKIVHGYCTRNARRLMTPKGRIELIKEFQHTTREIRKRDRAVCKVIDVFLEKYGPSTEITKQWADETWKHLNTVPPTGQKPTTH